MSGLPDEAVEAKCKCDRRLGHESWCPLYEMRAWVPLVVAERLVAAGTATIDTNSGTVYVEPSAAALPAGVYHSDGQGHVTSGEEVRVDELVDARARRMASAHGYDWPRCTDRLHEEYRARARAEIGPDVLAALSATDTEKAE